MWLTQARPITTLFPLPDRIQQRPGTRALLVVLRALFDDPQFSVLSRRRGPVVRRVGRVLLHTGVPLGILGTIVAPAAAARRGDRFQGLLSERLAQTPTGPAQQHLDRAEEILCRELFPILPTIFPLALVGFASLALAGRLLGPGTTRDELAVVLRGLDGNVTTEIDLGMPRWSEDPSHLFGVVRNYLRLDHAAMTPAARFAASAREAEDTDGNGRVQLAWSRRRQGIRHPGRRRGARCHNAAPDGRPRDRRRGRGHRHARLRRHARAFTTDCSRLSIR